MDKIRTNVELLKILKESYITTPKDSRAVCSGLCLFVGMLNEYNPTITKDDKKRLFIIVEDNPPKEMYNPRGKETGWYWKPGNKKPRIKWLDKMIKKYTDGG